MSEAETIDGQTGPWGEEVTEPLYPGDTGRLPEEARRVLAQLLSGPSLDGRRHSRLWSALIRYREVVASRLADLFLELIVDPDLRVAFVRQARTGDLDAPILLRRTRLTFLESVLLLYLRQVLAEADVRGERAVVSAEEMVEQMKLYEHNLNTDRAGFERRVRSAIEKVRKNSLLGSIQGSQDRYEVSPTLKLLFSAEEVAALARRFVAAREADPVEETPLEEDEEP